jgi:hypothetical protein
LRAQLIEIAYHQRMVPGTGFEPVLPVKGRGV